MKLSKAVQGFLLSRTAEGYSEHTINDYRINLERLSSYLGNPYLSEISPNNLTEFFAWLRKDYQPKRFNGNSEPLKPSTLNKVWCAIRSFYNWASSDLNIERPDTNLKAPKFERPIISPFTQEEIKAIIKATEYSKTAETSKRRPFKMRTPNALRDRALVLLLLDTGIRASECARLKVRDVNLETGEVFIMPHGTGRKTKSRHVYVGRASKKALWHYLASRSENTYPDDPLFLSVNFQPMNRNSIRLTINRLGNRANVSPCYPHLFRHTFAIQYLRNGGDVFTLQRLLGHSTLEMVRNYVTLADADTALTHRRASPVDRWNI